MAEGRTVWWAKDAGWWLRERIVVLGEEFGAAGPAVVDWLACQAKLQNDGGWVKTGPRSIARGCFVDVVTVGHVVSRAVTLGLLDEFAEEAGRFCCRISGWRSEQERANAANRKANQRGRESGNKGDPPPLSRSVTESHAPSRSVTECPPTGQDRTVHNSSLRSENNNAELRSAVTEIFNCWKEGTGHPQAHPSDDRLSKIRARLVERQRFHHGDLDAAIRDCRRAIDGAAAAAFVDDRGKRHDGIELIFRNNEKLEDFMGRASLPPGGQVVPMRRADNADALLRKIHGGDIA